MSTTTDDPGTAPTEPPQRDVLETRGFPAMLTNGVKLRREMASTRDRKDVRDEHHPH
jgi:hypothetical protein